MIKWLFKWIVRLALLGVLLVILIVLFKDSVLRMIVEQRIRSQTGMEAKIGRFSSGLFSPVVTLENLSLYNSADFGGTPFLKIPELHLEVDSGSLAANKFHLSLVRLNLSELDIVRNQGGQTNITVISKKLRELRLRSAGALKVLGRFEYTGIDVLNLTVGKAKYIDLADRRNDREVRINIENQVFRNVKSEADLYGVLFLVWMRSGGNLSFSPAELTNGSGLPLQKTEAAGK